MAGELDAPLPDVVPDGAAEPSAELAGKVNGVNAGRPPETLKRVMQAELVVDLFLHTLKPWRPCTSCFETGTPPKLLKQRDNDALHRHCGKVVFELKLPAQLKRLPMGRHAARSVPAVEIGQGVGGAEEHRRIDA